MVLLIVFGTRGVTYTTATGEFSCPTCGSPQPYRARRVRRFVSIYFFPLIPLGVMGEYVECMTCLDTFDSGVETGLESAASAAHERFHGAALRVMVWVMLADGRIEPEERAAIGDAYERLTGAALGAEILDAEVAACERDEAPITEYLSALVGRLNEEGKESILRAAIFVASSDGRIDTREALLLREIGAALEVAPARLRSVLAEVAAA